MNESEITKYPYSISGSALIGYGITELPTVVEPILPKVGVVALGGESDCGKSTLLRTLAMTIVNGSNNFQGWQVNATHNSAIYVSSEDDEFAISYLMNKQTDCTANPLNYDGLRYIFETEGIIDKLKIELTYSPADLVIVDAFADLYAGELNAANKVRYYINQYYEIAKKHSCLVIFLHHTGKRTQNLPPSKDNLLGSQGFEAKMRMVMELRVDPNDRRYRHLCIVKGNYLPSEMKTHSFKLEFMSNLTFRNTGERTPFANLVPNGTPVANNEGYREQARCLRDDGLSITQVHERLRREGCNAARSTVGNWLKR